MAKSSSRSSGSSSSGSGGSSSSSRSSGSSSSGSGGSSSSSRSSSGTILRSSSGVSFNTATGVRTNADKTTTQVRPARDSSSPSRKEKNPVTGSSPIRAERSSLERGIKDLRSSYNSERALMQEQQQALADRRTQTIGDLKSEYDISSQQQQLGQASDYAARSTNLITSGGGFLGATQSQEGVLQNLKGTFDAERTALFAKREAAINAANIAYEDKDFALAREMSKNATDLQKEIYNRQTNFADQQLKIAAGNRAQTEFDINIAKDKIEAYAKMSDEDFNNINEGEFSKNDSYYYPGYTVAARAIAKQAANLKTTQDQVDLDYKILTARLATDVGKTFKLGGVTYTGMKTKDTGEGTQADRDRANKQEVQRLFTSNNPVPGLGYSIGFTDAQGKATPEGWQTAYEASSMSRRTFVEDFGYLLKQSGVDSNQNPVYNNYGLTPAEVEIVNSEVPVNY